VFHYVTDESVFLGMPDEDGFDLIRQIRARGHHAKDLPAIALSAFVHKNGTLQERSERFS
jgi:CheY-like chemotaxis protein